MYLSRLILNPTDRRVRRDQANFYELHRTLMRGFPPELPADERVLFRLDEDGGGRPLLLVQSRTAPDWGGLPAGYLSAADPFEPLPNPAVKCVQLAFHPGQALRFRLRANPTVKKSGGPGRQGQRVALAGEEAHLAWLARKGEDGGFRPLAGVNVADLGRVFGGGRKRAGGDDTANAAAGSRPAVELHVVQFDGLLAVTDPARFGQTLLAGIGSAKGFGCGLLSLARV